MDLRLKVEGVGVTDCSERRGRPLPLLVVDFGGVSMSVCVLCVCVCECVCVRVCVCGRIST